MAITTEKQQRAPGDEPGAREQLAALPAGMRTFIASNQAGPAFRAVMNDPKYPTVEDVVARIADGLAALYWRPHLLLICTCSGKEGAPWYRAEHHAAQQFDRLLPLALGSLPVQIFITSFYRKPHHGMLAAGAWELRNQSDTTLTYIGDMESDRQAAAAANCRYLDDRRKKEEPQHVRRPANSECMPCRTILQVGWRVVY